MSASNTYRPTIDALSWVRWCADEGHPWEVAEWGCRLIDRTEGDLCDGTLPKLLTLVERQMAEAKAEG